MAKKSKMSHSKVKEKNNQIYCIFSVEEHTKKINKTSKNAIKC